MNKTEADEDRLHLIARKMARAVEDLEALAANITTQFRTGGSGDRTFDRIAAIQAYLEARRLRERVLPSHMLGEPGWDILLNLYMASLEDRAVPLATVCSACSGPSVTALLWLDKLAELGLVDRTGDTADPREAEVRLSEKSRNAIDRWADHALLQDRSPFST